LYRQFWNEDSDLERMRRGGGMPHGAADHGILQGGRRRVLRIFGISVRSVQRVQKTTAGGFRLIYRP
jgi:hypothetical protein